MAATKSFLCGLGGAKMGGHCHGGWIPNEAEKAWQPRYVQSVNTLEN